MDTALLELAKHYGVAGGCLYFAYRLLDKWAALFLAAVKESTAAATNQATSIAALVQAVQAGQGEQHEVLLAVRVMARQMEQLVEARK